MVGHHGDAPCATIIGKGLRLMASRLIDRLDGLIARAKATASTAWSLPQTPAEWPVWRPRALARLQ